MVHSIVTTETARALRFRPPHLRGSSVPQPGGPGPGAGSSPAAGSDRAAPRLASVADRPGTTGAATAVDAIARAQKAVADCQETYRHVRDYTCTFVKRERVDGRLTAPHIIE